MSTQWSGRQVEYELSDTQLFRLSNAKGCRVQCLTGTALITVFGELDDFTLHPGETLVIPNHGLALVEAIGRGRVTVKPPLHYFTAGFPLLLWRALRGQRTPSSATVSPA